MIANFEETQLPGMQVGQPVTFTVDTNAQPDPSADAVAKRWNDETRL